MSKLAEIERALDESDARSERLCCRLEFCRELAEQLVRDGAEHLDPRLVFLEGERERQLLAIREELELASKLDVARERALRGEII